MLIRPSWHFHGTKYPQMAGYYCTYALVCCFVLFLVFHHYFLISIINSWFDMLEKLRGTWWLPLVFCCTFRKTVLFWSAIGDRVGTRREVARRHASSFYQFFLHVYWEWRCNCPWFVSFDHNYVLAMPMTVCSTGVRGEASDTGVLCFHILCFVIFSYYFLFSLIVSCFSLYFIVHLWFSEW